jgi:hypothetical protein
MRSADRQRSVDRSKLGGPGVYEVKRLVGLGDLPAYQDNVRRDRHRAELIRRVMLRLRATIVQTVGAASSCSSA